MPTSDYQKRLQKMLMAMQFSPGAQSPVDLTPEMRRNATVVVPGAAPNRPVQAISPPGSTALRTLPLDAPGLSEAMGPRTGPPFVQMRQAAPPQMVPRVDVLGNLSQADANTTRLVPESFAAPEDDVLTPPGVLAPSEMKKSGGFLSKLGDMMSAPATQQFLGQMGIAFTGGDPNSAGTILGKAGIENAQSRMEEHYLKQLMAGKKPGEINVAGISGESKQRATATYLAGKTDEREDTRLGYEGTRVKQEGERIDITREDVKSLINARERGLLNEAQQIDIAKAKVFLDMRELDFSMGEARFNRQMAQARVKMEERMTTAQVRSTNALASLHEVQAAAGGWAPDRSGGTAGDIGDWSLILRRVSESTTAAFNEFTEVSNQLTADEGTVAEYAGKKKLTPAEQNMVKAAQGRLDFYKPKDPNAVSPYNLLRDNAVALATGLGQVAGAGAGRPAPATTPPPVGTATPTVSATAARGAIAALIRNKQYDTAEQTAAQALRTGEIDQATYDRVTEAIRKVKAAE